MGTTDNNIILDLENSSNATAFGTANIIHSSEFDKINKEISIRIINAEKANKAEIKGNERTNALDTITILGSRGSGKTSFLKSVAKHCKENNNIAVINIIDPTMIEEKGHIFLTIISQIKVKVEKRLQKLDHDNKENIFCKREEWKKKLRKLSAGLPSIDGINTSMDGWQDSEYVMDKGLQGVQSAMELADNFHELVKHALEVLDKKMFILMLDDIDIDFLKGWPVLETVRKYLTTPLITTIVSGDMRLFSKAVRKKQWSNFGKALLKNEAEKLERMSEFNNVVTEMEGQYLQKVLKPQYRIKLSTLLEKYTHDKNFKVLVNFKDNTADKDKSKNEKLKNYYSDVLSIFGINNSYQKECYINFLLGLPLRTQIQFLIKTREEDNLREVIEVFSSELYEKGIDIDLATALPKFTASVILDTLIKNKDLDDAYQLQPTSTDLTSNCNYMAFTMLYSILTPNNKFLIFDYFVKIGYIRNLLSLTGYSSDETFQRHTENERKTHSFCIEDLIKHSSITKDRNTRDIMCYTTAYMSAYFNQNATSAYAGIVTLYGLAVKAKGGEVDKQKRLDWVFSAEDITSQQIAYIPASMSQGDKQSTVFTYSVYVLLGAISEIIKAYHIDKDKIEVVKSIQKMTQIRAYPMPNGAFNIERENDELEDSTEYSDKTTTTPKASDDLADYLIEWLNMANSDFKVSPHVLGKIATRMYYAIKSIETNVKPKNIGETMHRRIIAIMNSILVADITENINENSNINNNNPVSSDDIFINNLNHINQTNNSTHTLNFSRWMLSCPLFLLYLDYGNGDKDSDKLEKALIKYIIDEKYLRKIFKASIYKTLSKVPIRIAITKVKFSYAKNKINNTSKEIHKTIGHDSFLSQESKSPDLINTLKLYFDGNINELSINKVKEYIKNTQ